MSKRTGSCGKPTLLKCLEKGYLCSSMSRKGTPSNKNEILRSQSNGEVLEHESLNSRLKDHDTEISCLGSPGNLGIKNILKAMISNNIHRLDF